MHLVYSPFEKDDEKLLERFPENRNFKEKVSKGEKHVGELSVQIKDLNDLINKEAAKENYLSVAPSSKAMRRALILANEAIDLEQRPERTYIILDEYRDAVQGICTGLDETLQSSWPVNVPTNKTLCSFLIQLCSYRQNIGVSFCDSV